MMYTRAAFYATEPSNAAVYAPVEACGAHEWSYVAHEWRAFAATQPLALAVEPAPPSSQSHDYKTNAQTDTPASET